MPKITLTPPIVHRNTEKIAIGFKYDQDIKIFVQSLACVFWSQTQKTYYTHYSNENRYQSYNNLRGKNWFVDYSALKDRKPVETLEPKPQDSQLSLPVLKEEVQRKTLQFKRWMDQKRLSPEI